MTRIRTSQLVASFCIVSTFFYSLQSFANTVENISEKNIKVTANVDTDYVSIFRVDPTGIKNKVADCSLPCDAKLKIAEPFFILIPTPFKEYQTYIRRNSDNAKIDDKTFDFKVIAQSPTEEAHNYYRLYAGDFNNIPERLACLDFDISELTNRPRACYKNQPIIPAKTERSGWCEMSFSILVDGSTDDVNVIKCSEDLFRVTSIEAAKLFRYYPRLKDGVIAPARMKTKVKFTLMNDKGKRVPARGE